MNTRQIQKSPLDELMDIQTSFGYASGQLNPVAFMGLFGECGEVAELITFRPLSRDANPEIEYLKSEKAGFCQRALLIDFAKKGVRQSDPYIKVVVTDMPALCKELADHFYYLLAVATCLDLTLDDLATISLTKLKAKQLNHSN